MLYLDIFIIHIYLALYEQVQHTSYCTNLQMPHTAAWTYSDEITITNNKIY